LLLPLLLLLLLLLATPLLAAFSWSVFITCQFFSAAVTTNSIHSLSSAYKLAVIMNAQSDQPA
jgi:hypothetical protein